MGSVLYGKPRYMFLDIARGLAILEMIHGHCLHALLSTSLQDSGFMSTWHHVRGYTAPLFLLIAGFAFAVTTVPALDEYTRVSRRLMRRVSKVVFIILLGYVLHLPSFSLTRTLASIGSPSWDAFLNVDILQCIGVSLLLLQLIYVMRLKTVARILVIALVTAGVAVAVSYLPCSAAMTSLPPFIRAYVGGSYFPLFPFSAYLFCGALCGEIFVLKKGAWSIPAILISICFIVLSFGRFMVPGLQVTAGFLLRSGILLLIVVMLHRGESLWRRLPPLIKAFCMESLILYVLHLFVVYGSVFNKGLSQLFGRTFTYPELYATFVILAILLTGIAYAWHTLKRVYPRVAFSFRHALYLTFIIRFLTRS